MPSFAESYEELSERYVTRAAWSEWVDIFSANIEQLDLSMSNKLYNEIRFEMWSKNMKDETDPVVYVKQIEQYNMKKHAIEAGQASNVYTISFVMNGGLWKSGKQPLMYRKGDDETQLPDIQDIYCSGKVFVGWYDNINFDGGVVTSIPASTNKATLFFAKWRDLESGESPEDYSGSIRLSYHQNGGSWVSGYSPNIYYRQESGMTLPSSTQIKRAGYDFDGWYKTSECRAEDKIINIADHLDTPINDVYANWTEASYNITYNLNGGSWNSFTPTSSRLYTEQVTLPTSADVIYADHIFIGWYENSSCVGSKIVSIPAYTSSDKTLYAKWVQTTYSITLIENGGSYVGITEPTSRQYASSFTLPDASQINKTGSTFAGWYESSSFYGSAVTVIAANTEGNKTYYAKWNENTYTMNYHLTNGSTSASLPSTRKYSESISLPNIDKMTANSGYKFRGWFSDSGLTNIITGVSANTETTDVYAGFVQMNDWSSINNSSWMSKIPDDMYLSEINIPGTHDAGCYKVQAAGNAADFFGSAAEEFAKTQSYCIVGDSSTQFEMGVRAFDIRLDDNRRLCHGDDNVVIASLPLIGDITANLKFFCRNESNNNITIDAVFDKASKFLNDHPTETVIFLVTNESGSGTKANAKSAVESCISTYTAGYNSRTNYKGVYSGTTIPKLGDVRGKIVILSDGLSLSNCINYSGMKGGTLDGVNYVYENHYEEKKEDKWNYVKTALDKCTTKINTQKNKSSKTAKSANIWTTSNRAGSVDLSNTPNEVDDYIDPKRSSYGWVQGNAYGIIWMDFVRTADTKLIIKTNP